MRLFGEGQFHAVAVPTLARLAGVSEGSIYNYFSSKEDVALAALAESSTWLESAMLEALPPTGSPLDQLLFAGAAILQAASDEPERTRFVLLIDHALYLGDRARDAFGLLGAVELLISSASASGLTRDLPPRILADLWLAIISSGVRQAIADGRSDDVTAQVAEAAIAAIRA